MIKNIFEKIYDANGGYGLQCKFCEPNLLAEKKRSQKQVLIAWRSPYASADENAWLEKNLHRIYSKYYLKVIVSNYGKFF